MRFGGAFGRTYNITRFARTRCNQVNQKSVGGKKRKNYNDCHECPLFTCRRGICRVLTRANL